MDTPGIHKLPRARVVQRLRAMGFRVEVLPPHARYDFLLDTALRVSLRTGFLTARPSRVRVRDRHYRYVRRMWSFNFHRHGHVGRRYCDFFICLPLVPSDTVDLRRAYIIPWEVRSGLTLRLPQSLHRYGGRYARYRNAWDLLQSRRRRGSAPPDARAPLHLSVR